MKKLLSIILATAMLISLIPAVFADDTATEAGIKIVYDFKNHKIADNAVIPKENKTYLDLTDLSYTETSGFWEYASSSISNHKLYNGSTGLRPDTEGYIKVVPQNVYLNETDPTKNPYYWVAFKLNVPKSGYYDLNMNVYAATVYSDTWVNVYVFNASDVSNVADRITGNNEIKTTNITAEETDVSLPLSKQYLVAGEHYFVFKPCTTRGGEKNSKAGAHVTLKSLTLTEGDGLKSVPIISSLTADENQVTATAAKMSNGDTATDVTYSYAVAADDTDLAEVDANTGVVTGKADGTATIIATATKDGYSSSKSIEVAVTAPAGEPEEDEPLVEEFVKEEEKEDISASYVEATVTGLELNGNTIVAEENTDGTYNLTAPKKEEKFLYWAMGLVGNKRIVSFSETLENYVPEGNYRNYLVPVYEGDVDASKKEFYNQNGQLIPDATENTAVSMPGYGGTSSWKQYGDTNIYVADYGKTEEQRDEVTVTVVGGKGTDTVLFGETVTCIADDEDANGNPFKCWKKTIGDTTEIVSIDSTYKFRAWEKCTVTAVYEEHTPISTAMKIIIDDFVVGSETGVMAEFIGLDDAVEKGIMFTAPGEEEATKLAMTTKDNQFTVIADAAGTYEGYAIVGNAADGYSLITDGLYTK